MITMKRFKTRRLTSFKFNNRMLLLIDVSLDILFILYLVPLINRGFEYVMDLTKQSYITPKNLIPFLTSLPTIILILLLFIALPLFLFIKLASLINYCNNQGNHKSPFVVFAFGFFETFDSLRKRKLALIVFSIPFYFFTNLPVLIGISYQSDLKAAFRNLDESLFKKMIVILLLLLAIVSFHGIFTIHNCINEDLSFKDGYLLSKKLLRGRRIRTLVLFFLTNLSLTLIYFLFYYFLLFLTAIMVYFFTDKGMAVTVFLSAYPKISFYATTFFSMFAFITNINLITSLYHTYQEESLEQILSRNKTFRLPIPCLQKKHKYIVNLLLICIIIASLVNFYLTIRNDAFYLKSAFTGIQISSHRGNSHVAPENTIPALENAIIANSDYAEIDVQQTKDGTLVLLHDNSLIRTAGTNRYIWDMSLDEVNQLDVGSWFGVEFLDTKIPTLEEALIYCKGKIKLNIEIKKNKNQPGLEETLVALIEQYEYEYQCVVSSTNYEALMKVNELNNDIKIGFILPAVYGKFYEKPNIDFFSIRSGYISLTVVENAHKAGKEVHAWTVNTTREIERMKSIGVDSIITDNPTKAREIIYRDDTNDTFIQLIRRMIKNRTLYRFINQ